MNDKEKIKNAVRIIDARIEHCLEMKRELDLGKTPYEKMSPVVLGIVSDMFERQKLLLQKIRDELIPEEKS